MGLQLSGLPKQGRPERGRMFLRAQTTLFQIVGSLDHGIQFILFLPNYNFEAHSFTLFSISSLTILIPSMGSLCGLGMDHITSFVFIFPRSFLGIESSREESVRTITSARSNHFWSQRFWNLMRDVNSFFEHHLDYQRVDICRGKGSRTICLQSEFFAKPCAI